MLQVSERFELNKRAQGNSGDHGSTTVSIAFAGSTLSVMGAVDFTNANAIFKEGKQLTDSLSSSLITIDLAQLTQSHTVLLAVIVQWVRGLRSEQRIHLENVPPKMRAIILASRLQDVLY